jgi:hypothetical protein
MVPYTRGKGLDLGCGPEKGFPHFRGIDSNKDQALFGQGHSGRFHHPDVRSAGRLRELVAGLHRVVAPSRAHQGSREGAARVVADPAAGGHLCLYLPHKDFYPNIGTEGANPDHVHDFHPDDIIAAMKKIGGWDLVENQERNEGDEYSFFQVYKKYADAKSHRFSYREPKPAKTCAIVRYGAWGDVIQMSSVLPP